MNMAQLFKAGVNLFVIDGRLVLDAPEGVVTSELVAEMRAVKPELIDWCKSLAYFQQSAKNAGTLDKMYRVLLDFSDRCWSLTERAAMSNSYSPRLLRLIGQNANKYQILEECAALCWKSRAASEEN